MTTLLILQTLAKEINTTKKYCSEKSYKSKERWTLKWKTKDILAGGVTSKQVVVPHSTSIKTHQEPMTVKMSVGLPQQC